MDLTPPLEQAPREPRPVPVFWIVLEGVLIAVAVAVVLGALPLGLWASVLIGGGSLLGASVLEAVTATTYTGPGRRAAASGRNLVVLTLMVGLLLASLLLAHLPGWVGLIAAALIGTACALVAWDGHRRALRQARADWERRMGVAPGSGSVA